MTRKTTLVSAWENYRQLGESDAARSVSACAASSAPPTAKEIYREFSRSEESLPIFSRDWWLDATVGPDSWDVAIVCKGNQVVASMPYVLRRRYGMRVIGQPALTHKLGPWLRDNGSNSRMKLAHEQELLQALIDQLPDFDYFVQNWDYNRTNWLPFLWNGFKETTRYTYVLTELSDTEKLWHGLHKNTRAECKKALTRFDLKVRDDLPLDDFLRLNHMTFARQGRTVPYSDDYVKSIDDACAGRGCRKIFIAVDPQGQRHAGLYIVWDEFSAYGLMTGSNPALRTSGAVSLCFWEAIRHAAGVTQRFDFAGSIIQPIERFFRGFSATQFAYFNISKTRSRLLLMQQGLLAVIKGE